MSNTSRLVEKLRLKGLLQRNPGQEDRRQVEVNITQKGIHLLHEIDGPIMDMHAKLELSNDEAETLNRLLDKLRT